MAAISGSTNNQERLIFVDLNVLFLILLALITAWSLTVNYRLRKQLRLRNQALIDLVEGLRLTVEYVGTDVLPPIRGWAWYDALSTWSPAAVAMIGTREYEHSNLVSHAHKELLILGEDEDTIQGLLRVVRAFADMGHSGGSVMAAIPMLNQLLQMKPLTPLTDDPDEWYYHGKEMWDGENGVWQNRRDGECFSKDGGLTYTRTSDRNETIYTSLHMEDGQNFGFKAETTQKDS